MFENVITKIFTANKTSILKIIIIKITNITVTRSRASPKISLVCITILNTTLNDETYTELCFKMFRK